jgi:hypothetical protein
MTAGGKEERREGKEAFVVALLRHGRTVLEERALGRQARGVDAGSVEK